MEADAVREEGEGMDAETGEQKEGKSLFDLGVKKLHKASESDPPHTYI